jgi:FkbM family methyltransferase
MQGAWRSSLVRNIELPERAYRDTYGSYGDQHAAAKYCGLAEAPYSMNGEWQHGWIGPERNIHPEFAVGGDGRSYERRKGATFYVAREDQVDYLKSRGYEHVHAVGLPIVYVAKPALERVPGSLLVMPAHSLPETKEQWDADAYAAYVRAIATRFAKVCLCVHKTCAEKGNWAPAFKGLGIHIVEGAEERDQNSLLRMAMLFSQFEFLTSNAYGSHLVYASYFGCKTSVSGPRPSWKRRDYENVPFYKNAPDVLDIVDQWNSTDHWSTVYPQFLREPWEATLQQEWAAWQLGEQCRKSPRQLRKLFGWDFAGYAVHLARRVMAMPRGSYRFARTAWPLISTLGVPGLVAAIQLKAAARNKSGLSRIWCGWKRRLIVRNGSSDLDVFQQHFARREILGIRFDTQARTVIDLGANIGVSVEAFRRLFPRARIIAVELEKHNAELCKANHASDKLVSVLNGAIWSEAGQVSVTDVGEGEWAYRTGPSARSGTASVPAYTYRQILDTHGIRRVDVLKMDIEGAEADVLESAWEDIFATTTVAIIEVHDWIEGVAARVNRTIEQAREKFDLQLSRSGEFLIVRNKALGGS